MLVVDTYQPNNLFEGKSYVSSRQDFKEKDTMNNNNTLLSMHIPSIKIIIIIIIIIIKWQMEQGDAVPAMAKMPSASLVFVERLVGHVPLAFLFLEVGATIQALFSLDLVRSVLQLFRRLLFPL